jgi:hypothetical protein
MNRAMPGGNLILTLLFLAAWTLSLPLLPCGVQAGNNEAPLKKTRQTFKPDGLLRYDLSHTGHESQLMIRGQMDFEHPHYIYLKSPQYRFVLDLPYKTKSCSGTEKVTVDRKDLKSFNVACQPNQKLRFVLYLGDQRVCRVTKKDDGLILTISEGENTLPYQAADTNPKAGILSPVGTTPAPTDTKQDKSTDKSPSDSPGQAAEASATPLISCNFFQADLKEFFSLLSKVSNKRIELSPDVEGKITMRLDAIPWDQALETVVGLYKLQVTPKVNVLYISPNKEPPPAPPPAGDNGPGNVRGI